MNHELDVARFRELKAQASSVTTLRHRVQSILARRPLRSFDGFGHFLDAVLGEDQQVMDTLARTVHLPSTTIEQLRASELDPFATSLEKVAYLGFLLGIDTDDFARLADIDHTRFARHSDSVFARSDGDGKPHTVDQLQQLWKRFEEDQASGL